MIRNPIVALVYDFDKTLCTKDMQEYGFISKMGMTPGQFWAESKELTNREHMDAILAYMYKMVETARDKKVVIRKEDFLALGKNVEYFDGVLEWFDRISAYGKDNGVRIEHYIVSSGIKEIIDGTEIAAKFKRIYACEFMYDYTGTIVWPKFAVDYTTKPSSFLELTRVS